MLFCGSFGRSHLPRLPRIASQILRPDIRRSRRRWSGHHRRRLRRKRNDVPVKNLPAELGTGGLDGEGVLVEGEVGESVNVVGGGGGGNGGGGGGAAGDFALERGGWGVGVGLRC